MRTSSRSRSPRGGTLYADHEALDIERPRHAKAPGAQTLLGLVLVFAWVAPLHAAPLEPCERMESQNQLLYQQFKASKTCKESAIGRGWTDCVFKAGRTEILLVGAIGMDATGRMAGRSAAAFRFVPSTRRITSGIPARDARPARQRATQNRISDTMHL